MFQPSPAVRIFPYGGADMRKSFDGLSAIVTASIGKNLLNRDYSVFFNRNRDRCKILLWDRDGFVIWAKRLEQGSFQAYKAGDFQGQAVEGDATTLAMILGSINVNCAKRRKRFALSA